MLNNIRNFSIIAHIDHGKSTLADRILEITKTIPERKMREQVLDSMDLERERGITIKMQPVRMDYRSDKVFDKDSPCQPENFILNLIDTPGHIDFSYEVSRALKAVEGSILLIDATQGAQAQTFTTLDMAIAGNLKIIPVISKIDSPLARIEEVKNEVVKLLNCEEEDILLVSGRTGEGVKNLLDEVVKRIPAPGMEKFSDKSGSPVFGKSDLSGTPGSPTYPKTNNLQALIFDFKYSSHRGVIIFVRIFSGQIKKGDNLFFVVAGEKFNCLEVGIFSPEEKPMDSLNAGEIGYIVTGIKKPGIASVGDTITQFQNPMPALAGYQKPIPVVWASVFPEDADYFEDLKMSLGKLKLSDSAFSYEEESSGVLGHGFRCGFLGMLHLEIITERLKREFNLQLVITTPSITYEVLLKNQKDIEKREKIFSPCFFPDDNDIQKIFEPWVKIKIILPSSYLGSIMKLLFEHEAEIGDTENFGNNRSAIFVKMPLRELMRDFFDELKSVSSGYGSISYEMDEMREASITRLDVIIADDVVPAFSRVISRSRAEDDAEKIVEKLVNILPRQNFVAKIQAKALGRIIASRTLQAFRKDVTGGLYGGDITRRMKLLEKQKKGKKKMKERGKMNIPAEIFIKMMRSKE
ncbi:MAG: GTP-binding protein [Patescibacteria group bacterium]